MADRIRDDLLQLAWPAALATLVQQLYRPNDMFFVRELGAEAQAAIGVGSMVSIFYMAFGQMVGLGTLALTTRRLGRGEREAGHATIRRGLRCGMLVGALLALLLTPLLPWICGILVPGDDPASLAERELLRTYLQWITWGQLVMVTVPVVDQGFFALKDSRTPLLLQGFAVLSNAGLNALLVGPFGVLGIAWATISSRSLALVLGLWLLHRRGVGMPWLPSHQGAAIRRILAVGAPACVAVSIYALVYMAILALSFEQMGAAARSTLGIGFGIETQFYCLYWGIASAQASLVGRYLGEQRQDKALAVTRLAVRCNLWIGLGTAAVFWSLGPQLVGWFSEVAEVRRANVDYLFLMAFAQPLQAIHEAWVNALIGAGRTAPVMVSTGVMNLLRIPLAHLFGVVWGYGLSGIWWAVNLSTLGKAIWSYLLFRRGAWLDHDLDGPAKLPRPSRDIPPDPG